MKKSTMMLTGGAAVILIILIALISFFRISADRFIKFTGNTENTVEQTGIIETKELDFNNFDSLYFSSVWEVDIKKGDEYKVILIADKAIIDDLEVEKNDRELSFSYDKYLRGVSSGSSNVVKVEIILPDLIEINFSGLGNLTMYDLHLNDLKIINSGASNIKAENVVIDKLSLIVNGAANAELSNIKIKNCYLDISGAANIELYMTGGRLSGQVSGAASVVYSGNVSEESVTVSGIGSLKKN